MGNREKAVEMRGVRKSFGSLEVLKGIDLQVSQGTIMAVLGPNGAGKTTMIHILATLLQPDAGEAGVFGFDVTREADKVRALIGLAGQFAAVDEELGGRENLQLFGRLYGFGRREARIRADELLEAFELAEAGHRAVSGYSGGMRRRLDIAAAMMVTPRLLFLDEPTTGLDPRSRNGVWEIIRALAAHGTTVLLTTQYLEEADQLADRIVIIDEGRVIAEGTASEMKASVGAGTLHIRLSRAEQREEAARLLERMLGTAVDRADDSVNLSAQAPDPAVAAQTVHELAKSGFRVMQFSLSQPSLDEVFLALTGRSAEERGNAG